MNEDDVNQAIDALNSAQSQLLQLEAALIDKNKSAEASKISAQSDELTSVISDLESQALEQWAKDSDQVIAAIQGMSNELQSKIDGISKDISLANNVVGALSIVDQILSKAKGFLA